MREMILNHASISSCAEADRDSIPEWIEDISKGIGGLINSRIVRKRLLSARRAPEIFWYDGYSLWDSLMGLGRKSDSCRLIIMLMRGMPSLGRINDLSWERFERCENKPLSDEDGHPLLLSAVSNGISIGFPTDSVWHKDRIRVDFIELLPDGENVEHLFEEVDQLTCSAHFDPIYERHQEDLICNTSPRDFWLRKEELFPNLTFGPDVEHNIRDQSRDYSRVCRRLKMLNQAAREWQDHEGHMPPWDGRVRSESETVMNNPRLSQEREFRSSRGAKKLFYWHINYSKGGRIHLRFDRESFEVEIGYIGSHLPTAKH